MCKSDQIFAATKLSKKEVAGKRVLEVGSYDVDGILRGLIESWSPAQYIGVDIKEGPGVDLVCDAEELLDKFPAENFDVVFAVEVLEHVINPKTVISNMKRLCKRNGIILLTTRSKGYPFHPSPYDFWRYEPSDMESFFSDCEIIDLEKDFDSPGVFVKVKKPDDFAENDLSKLELYNIATNKQALEVTIGDLSMKLRMRLVMYQAVILASSTLRRAYTTFVATVFKFDM
jgi:SAM-dependent methyltransferase